MKLNFGKRHQRFKMLAMATILAVGQAVSSYTPMMQEVYAADDTLSGHWAAPYLDNLLRRGVIRGDISGNLLPDIEITRAEFVSMINRSLGYTKIGSVSFKDVNANAWYADDIAIAYEEGYFEGTGKNQANPEGYLTREEAVSMLCRTLKVKGISGENFNLRDSRTFSMWARDYINAALDKQYVSGYEDGTFRPTNHITRGEAAKVITFATGEIINSSGYNSFGYIEGNATISASGVNLEDTVITGDLYITDGVGLGYTTLKNVKVLGEVIISGAGESNVGQSSITLTDCHVKTLTIDGSEDKTLTLKTDGSTVIETTRVITDAYLEELTDKEGGFDTVILMGDSGTTLNLAGSFNEVKLMGESNNLNLTRGYISKLSVDELGPKNKVVLEKNSYISDAYIDTDVNIGGEGDVGHVIINAEGVVITMLPDDIEIRPGITATINGKKVSSTDAEMLSSYPKIMSGYPDIHDIEPAAAVATFEVNKPGTLYWVITLEEDDSPKTADIVKPPKNDEDIIKSGNVKAKGGEEFDVKLSGLKTATEYTIYAVLVDEKDDESSKKSEDFETVDNIVPAYASGYPNVNEVSATSATVAVNTTKNCDIYWAVFPTKAVAPTEKELKNQTVDGEVAKGTYKKSEKNKESTFSVSGLQPATTYDLYMVATDGYNTSTANKLTFTTKDNIAPLFLEGYPRQDKVSANAVTVRYNMSKNCTVYYVVMPLGQAFPPDIDYGTANWSDDKVKETVVLGNNVFKKGTANATAEKEATFSISGLAKETAYDVYMVAKDKDGNYSPRVIHWTDVRTEDLTPPTAAQEFTDMVNKKPVVETDIRVVFSEVVTNALTKESFNDLIRKPGDIPSEASAKIKNCLEDCIVLYDVSGTQRKKINIDYDGVDVLLEDGKTVVIYHKAATNENNLTEASELKLKSGGRYEFELNNIMDIVGNKMPKNTRLEEFTTVSPMVQLFDNANGTESTPPGYDMSFSYIPESTSTSSSIFYDLIFETNEKIAFSLYEWPVGTDTPSTVPVFSGTVTPTGPRTFYSLSKPVSAKDYQFPVFNELVQGKEYRYAIKVDSVNGETNRDLWNQKIDFTVSFIAGAWGKLVSIANSTADAKEIINDGGVNYVQDGDPLLMHVYFKDQSTPVASVEEFRSGDIKIQMQMMTNKPTTCYYAIVPSNTISFTPDEGHLIPKGGKIQIPDPAFPDRDDKFINVYKEYELMEVTSPTAESLVNGMSLSNGKSGNFSIDQGGVLYDEIIEDLNPLTEYDIFYTFQSTSGDPTAVKMKRIYTATMEKPIIDKTKTDVTSRDATTISVKTSVTNTSSTIYWVAYPSGNYSETKMPKPEDIINIVENTEEGSAPADFGSGPCAPGERFDFVVGKNAPLKRISYDIFITAKSPLGGDPADVVVLWNQLPLDSTPPKINTMSTVIRQITDVVTLKSYSGTFGITFSESLYYSMEAGGKILPLKVLDLDKLLDSTLPKDGLKVQASSAGTDANEAIKGMNLQFNGAMDGDMIWIAATLSDSSKQVAGRLEFVFKVNKDDPTKSEWVTEGFKLETDK